MLYRNKNEKVWSGEKVARMTYGRVLNVMNAMNGLNVTYGERYHLECSGIKYKTKDYWNLNLDAYVFECSDCKQLFKGC